jgi:hypothetical protein
VSTPNSLKRWSRGLLASFFLLVAVAGVALSPSTASASTELCINQAGQFGTCSTTPTTTPAVHAPPHRVQRVVPPVPKSTSFSPTVEAQSSGIAPVMGPSTAGLSLLCMVLLFMVAFQLVRVARRAAPGAKQAYVN